jgi:glucose-6-phosphate isomerase
MAASDGSWARYLQHRTEVAALGLELDVARMTFDEAFLARIEPAMQRAFVEMKALEAGAVANLDEKRQVGHYWLRSPELAPTAEQRTAIEESLKSIERFAAGVHAGTIGPPGGGRFTHLLGVGIGGSSLGPMFVADALGMPGKDRLAPVFIDNTDPDGVARELARLGDHLKSTLVIVTSKSGGTPETRNGMLLVERAVGAGFAKQAVAITGAGSQLDRHATAQGWLARFPMWDWVGGRTSELSAVGLLPAALQGIAIREVLEGARLTDEATRVPVTAKNPAAMMAAMWFAAGEGRGTKDLVVLPYKDRLLLLSRYLQQLIMESLGKRLDRMGARVDQGLAVYGNKGSTDQHAYVQQLRDGLANFFVTFVRVLESGGDGLEVEPGVTAGDYLHGLLLGTQMALAENGRGSMTVTVPRVDARVVGGLIALFERAVGLYATLIDVNAYHQPGVEAGKKAAAAALEMQKRLAAALGAEGRRAEELAAAAGAEDVEAAYRLLEHLAANGRARREAGGSPERDRFARS